MEEYFKIMLGGLFGIATIVVAVMSLASNIINGKFLNMYINKMFRFKMIFSFTPIYYLVIYSLLIMKWNFLATNKGFVLIGIGSFLILITYFSYLSAQYVIDTKRFQNKVLKVSIKKLKKEMNEENANMLIVSYIKEAYKNINEEDCRIFQDEINKKKMYGEYINLVDIDNLSNENAIELLNVLIQEFGIDEAFKLCSNFKIGQLTYILLSLIDQNAEETVVNMCIKQIHSYYMYQALIEERRFTEDCRKITIINEKTMVSFKMYFIYTIKYLKNSRFVLKDAFYLSEILRQIYDIESFIDIEEICSDKEIIDFFNHLRKTKSTNKWEYNSSETDEAFQTALFMLGGMASEK